MPALSAILAHGAISSFQRADVPRVMCSAHLMNVSRFQISSNFNKSSITKNIANRGFNASSFKQPRALLTPCEALVNVEFLVPELPLEFGQSLTIVGGAPALGNWEASSGCALEWAEGNNWKGAAEIESGSKVEFKLVKVAGGDWASWEDGENKVLAIPASASTVEVVANWGGDISIKVSESTPAVAPVAEAKPKKSSTRAKSAPKKAKQEEKPVELAVATTPPFMAAAEPAVEKVEEKPAPAAPAPAAPVHSDNGSNVVNLPSELSSLASKISVGSDGALIIEFSGNADGVTAASLAAKYKN